MSRVTFFLIVIFVFCVSSCRKNKNEELARSYYRLAMLEVSHEQLSVVSYRKALEYAKKASTLQPTTEYLALHGTLLLRLNEYNESMKFFGQALEKATDDALATDIKNNLACAAAGAGQIERARQLWQELADDERYLTPEVALVNQGKLSVQVQNYQEARSFFNQAISLAPHYSDAYFYAALVSYHLKDSAGFKERLATLRFIDPDHKGATQLSQMSI